MSARRVDGGLFVHDVAKKANLGNLARTATAFGLDTIYLAGAAHKQKINQFGSHGAHKALTVVRTERNFKDSVDLLRKRGYVL